MRKALLYLKLCWLFTLSLFLPTTPLASRIEQLLAELAQAQPSESPP